ncbi:MAG: choice-of-anchor Q domain-containing protein [Paludibacteraceae bacterium]|nr:choice-of-anchor Q domain-containing protein [Paludibacteraceae bacterium]
MKKTLAILIALLLVASCVCAKTITVTSSADSGAGTLRQAVLDANANDSIIFDSSVTSITLSTVIRLEKNITITGNKNSTTTTTMLAPNSRHFVLPNTGVTATLNNLILKDGYFYTCGGSIYILQGNFLTLNNCFFTDNKADKIAGAIDNIGKLTINNCVFNNNICSSYGAGAIINDGEIKISNTTFISNKTEVVNSSTSYVPSAGALYNRQGTLTINNCLFKGNQGDVSGGLLNRGSANVVNCLFTGNTSIDFKNQGTIFNFNLGSYDVGSTSLTIVNTTITNNVGKGIYNDQTIRLYNSIVTNNNATQDIYNDSIGTITANNNLIGTSNVALSANGNILNTDPLFVGNGDFSLQKSSPAINAGDNSFIDTSLINIDLANNRRISDKTIDLGAYEFQNKSADIPINYNDNLRIYSRNQTIYIENASSPISVYNVMSQLITRGTNTQFTVPVAGVYIVRVGDKTQKIIVK